MKKFAALFLVSLVCVCISHPQIFTDSSTNAFSTSDCFGIWNGYKSIHTFSDTLKWWSGAWINGEVGNLRPAASYWHWLQCFIGETWGWGWVTASSVALFAGICAMTGTISFRFTESEKLPFVVAALSALAVPRLFLDRDFEMLSWWPVADNLVAILLALAAINSFFSYSETVSSKTLFGVIGFTALACLSKEWAYILPLCFGVICLFGVSRENENAKRCAVIAGASFASVVLLALYRRSVIEGEQHGTIPLEFLVIYRSIVIIAKDDFSASLFYTLDNLVAVLKPFIAAGLLYFAVKMAWGKRHKNAIILFALMMAFSYLPLREFPMMNHRVYFLWPFVSILTAFSLQQAVLNAQVCLRFFDHRSGKRRITNNQFGNITR